MIDFIYSGFEFPQVPFPIISPSDISNLFVISFPETYFHLIFLPETNFLSDCKLQFIINSKDKTASERRLPIMSLWKSFGKKFGGSALN